MIMGFPTDAVGRRQKRRQISIGAILLGVFLCVVGQDYVINDAVPVPLVGLVAIVVGVLGACNVNVFKGGPLDMNDDPPEPGHIQDPAVALYQQLVSESEAHADALALITEPDDWQVLGDEITKKSARIQGLSSQIQALPREALARVPDGLIVQLQRATARAKAELQRLEQVRQVPS
jgi:hypothetical protein